jgi:hypothetical protein
MRDGRTNRGAGRRDGAAGAPGHATRRAAGPAPELRDGGGAVQKEER